MTDSDTQASRAYYLIGLFDQVGDMMAEKYALPNSPHYDADKDHKRARVNYE